MPRIKKSVKKEVKKLPEFKVVLTIGNGKFEQTGETVLEAVNKFTLESVGDLGDGALVTVTSGDKKFEESLRPFQLRMLFANEVAKVIFGEKVKTLIN